MGISCAIIEDYTIYGVAGSHQLHNSVEQRAHLIGLVTFVGSLGQVRDVVISPYRVQNIPLALDRV